MPLGWHTWWKVTKQKLHQLHVDIPITATSSVLDSNQIATGPSRKREKPGFNYKT